MRSVAFVASICHLDRAVSSVHASLSTSGEIDFKWTIRERLKCYNQLNTLARIPFHISHHIVRIDKVHVMPGIAVKVLIFPRLIRKTTCECLIPFWPWPPCAPASVSERTHYSRLNELTPRYSHSDIDFDLFI